MVPEWLLDSTVSDNAIRIYAMLATYGTFDAESGWYTNIWPSKQTVAERTRRSTESVKRAVRELEAVGALTRQRRGTHGTNFYRLFVGPPPFENGDPTGGGTTDPLGGEGVTSDPGVMDDLWEGVTADRGVTADPSEAGTSTDISAPRCPSSPTFEQGGGGLLCSPEPEPLLTPADRFTHPQPENLDQPQTDATATATVPAEPDEPEPPRSKSFQLPAQLTSEVRAVGIQRTILDALRRLDSLASIEDAKAIHHAFVANPNVTNVSTAVADVIRRDGLRRLYDAHRRATLGEREAARADSIGAPTDPLPPDPPAVDALVKAWIGAADMSIPANRICLGAVRNQALAIHRRGLDLDSMHHLARAAGQRGQDLFTYTNRVNQHVQQGAASE